LVVLAVPFFFAGPIAGVVCLFLAACVAVVAWTPVGPWLGFGGSDHSEQGADVAAPPAPSGPCGDSDERLRTLWKGAHQLAWNLKHFRKNWWAAVDDENFDGKLPDDEHGPVTHEKAMETLCFMFGQFFSAAWTYQSFCRKHSRWSEVKQLVDEVYKALGMPRDTGGLPDDRIGSTELHIIGRLSTDRWGEPDSEPFDEVDFRAVLKREAEDFEPLRVYLSQAGPDTPARDRLEVARQRLESVEDWLKQNGYGPEASTADA
jgi:hypothetical protein